MGLFGKLVRVGIILTMLLLYAGVVWLGLTEESRRSLTLTKNSATTDDYAVVNVTVTSVDVARGLLYERIRLIPKGRFAIDRSTPAVDLKMLINSVSGKQAVMYPKGERIAPVDFTSILSGNLNHYPFDKYSSDIDILVTAPAPAAPPAPAASPTRFARPAPAVSPTPPAPAASPSRPAGPAPTRPPAASVPPVPAAVPEPGGGAGYEPDADPITTGLVIGASDLNKSESVSIKENFLASITGVKFEGEVSETDIPRLMRTSILMRRANNVIGVSIIVMVVMFVLAISIMVMAVRVLASRDAMNLLPLSLCVTLIFGLPALRNTQPGVPVVGVLGDYLSFIWAEFIVAMSAIVLAWSWIVRSMREHKSK